MALPIPSHCTFIWSPVLQFDTGSKAKSICAKKMNMRLQWLAVICIFEMMVFQILQANAPYCFHLFVYLLTTDHFSLRDTFTCSFKY